MSKTYEVGVCAKSSNAPWEIYVANFSDDKEGGEDENAIYPATPAGLLDALLAVRRHHPYSSARCVDIVDEFIYAMAKNGAERRAA